MERRPLTPATNFCGNPGYFGPLANKTGEFSRNKVGKSPSDEVLVEERGGGEWVSSAFSQQALSRVKGFVRACSAHSVNKGQFSGPLNVNMSAGDGYKGRGPGWPIY